MRKIFRMTVLTIVLLAQLLAGVGTSVSAEVSTDSNSASIEQQSVSETVNETTTTETSETITALSILQKAAEVKVQDSEYGPYVTSINGLEAEGTYYWGFYVNEELASEGIGTYAPNPGDVLTFKYESWQEETETTTEETIKVVGLEDDSTALSLLQEVEDVEVIEYDWGSMITSINGLAPKTDEPYFWAFYINGESSQVGAGSYTPKAGDVLTFQYESYDQNVPDPVPTVKYTIAAIPIDDQSSEDEQETYETITALKLLQKAAEVKVQDSEYGPYVTSINGLEAGGTYYWGFYVNDELASEGIGTYAPNPGDVLTFKYESWQEETETTTEETIKVVGLEDDSTALSLLQEVEDVEVIEYDWGSMITSINGLAPKTDEPYFWAFYINGESSQVGAGSYTPKAGDVLTFQYESYDQNVSDPVPTVKYVIAAIPKDDQSSEDELDDDIPEGTPTEKAIYWIEKQGSDFSIDDVISFRQLGEAIPSTAIQKVKDQIIEKNWDTTNPTDIEKSVLALLAIDEDPTDVNGQNLIEKIYNYDDLTKQGLNGLIFALLALDSKDYEVPDDANWTRNRIINDILDSQLSDGGWSLYGDTSSVDITAMVLTSLANYQNDSNVKMAVDDALEWLLDSQLENGGFLSQEGNENSQSTAQVIIALSALDEDITIFEKQDSSILDYLLTYQNDDGGFSNLKDGDSDSLATSQALTALIAYERFQNGEGSIYDLSVLPPLTLKEGNDSDDSSSTDSSEVETESITISVRTHESTILSTQTWEIEEGATALSVLLDALEGRVETTGYGSSAYVVSIDGLSEFDYGPTSGWKYSVNGYFPSSSAGIYQLNEGDYLEWIYVTEDEEAASSTDSNGTNDGIDEEISNSLEEIKEDPQKFNAVINLDQKMSAKEAQKIKTEIENNIVSVEKTVDPTTETVIADLAVEETKITIPKEALTEQKTIKIEELTSVDETASATPLKSSIYRFLPKGLEFEKPVVISIKIPIENGNVEDFVMAWFNEEKNKWEEIPTVIDAKTGIVFGEVDHFTKFAVIEKNAASTAMQALIQYLQDDDTQSEWEFFGLARLQALNKQVALDVLSKNLALKEGYFRKVTDYERYVLTIQALGGDPTNINGYNLIEKIYNNERMTMQGTNGLIFALLALDSGHFQVPSSAKWTRESILAEILAAQNEDGGFALVSGDPSDVDITAMAISSLVPYQEETIVKEAIDKAIQWLSHAQLENGGFRANGLENSESASQVIIALAAAGVDPQGDLFTKSNGDVVSNLLSYQNKDGGFANLKNEESDQIASEQALMALIALDRFHNQEGSIYQFEQQENVSVPVSNVSKPNFADRNEISSYALQSVYEAFDRGIMHGVEEKPLRFAPKQTLTRAQFTAVLVKLLDEDQYEGTTVVFADVKPNDWYYQPVMRAYELGMVAGTSDTTFSPNDPITREQVAVLLTRAFHLEPNSDNTNRALYSDISDLIPYNQQAIQALYDHNLMKGYENGLFKPKEIVTREMGAALAIRIDDQF